MKRPSAGQLVVILLVVAGLAGVSGTWWKYTHMHPFSRDAVLLHKSPPTVSATFSDTGFAIDKNYVAMVTFNDDDSQYSGYVRIWKKTSDGRYNAEILLKTTPPEAENTSCTVTLDLELQGASD
ncbi:MAG: hypothetical protein ABI443_01465 [Chthoniobacterales bacterium]